MSFHFGDDVRHIYTETVVNAPAARVWEILTAFAEYSEWNPFIPVASGKPKLGEKLSITLQPKPKQTFNFSPTLTAIVPDKALIWKGKLLIPGLFDGEHKFRLVSEGGKTRFIQEEYFSGILAYILPQRMFDNTKNGFEAMNRALKERAEGK